MQAGTRQAIDERAQRIVALVVAVSANALLGWGLLRMDGQPWQPPASTPATVGPIALQVQWIKAPDAGRHPPRTTPRVVERSAQADRLRAPTTRPLVQGSTPPPSDAPPPATTAASEALPDAPHPLDLGLRADRASFATHFRRALLDRPDRDALAVEPAIAVPMRDRSPGGVLARMTRNADCAELRRALRKADGPRLLVVLRAMQEHGCS